LGTDFSAPIFRFAITYDAAAAQLLHERIFDTSIQNNVTEVRKTLHDERFDEVCANMTQAERTELTLRWGDDMEMYLLTVDDIRENSVIPSILQVNTLRWNYRLEYCEVG